MAKGKEQKKYEFGTKASVVMTKAAQEPKVMLKMLPQILKGFRGDQVNLMLAAAANGCGCSSPFFFASPLGSARKTFAFPHKQPTKNFSGPTI